jgi:uncharacterized membrane protein (DUF373 family)
MWWPLPFATTTPPQSASRLTAILDVNSPSESQSVDIDRSQALPTELNSEIHPVRRRIVLGLSLVEDVVYVGLGTLLAIAAFSLLAVALKTTVFALWHRTLETQVVSMLDQILLILLVIELLYTVQVSFREHALLAEPFLVIAMIAVIRRVLVITAELPKLPESTDIVFRHAMWELALLTVMIAVLVSSLIMLQKQDKQRNQQTEPSESPIER